MYYSIFMNNVTTYKKTRISSPKLFTRIAALTDNEQAILRLLDDFHYAYGSHIQRLFFTSGSTDAMTRARNRLLSKLTDEALLYRYPRKRLPGNRHGSTEYIYALTHAGQRIMNELRVSERPYRSIEHTTAHYIHALSATELYVQMIEKQRTDEIKLIKAQGEPSSHRHFGINRVLKPDEYFLFHLTKDGQKFEVAWFIEIEHSRQGEPTVRAKIETYRDYRKQLNPTTELMPRVLFVTFAQSHYSHLAKMISRNAESDKDVFVVKLFEETIPTMLTII